MTFTNNKASTTTTSNLQRKEKNPVALFRDQLLAEEPKIDAALKAFCSYIVASSSSSSSSSSLPGALATTSLPHGKQQQQPVLISWNINNALACTRQLSKAINAHIVPVAMYDKKKMATAIAAVTPESLMMDTVARVWNELAGQQQQQQNVPGTSTKITKVLGRTALRYVWKDLLSNVLQQQQQQATTPHGRVFCETFGQFLLLSNDDADATLIWGGPDALAHRAAERLANASRRVFKEQEAAAAAEQIRQAIIQPPTTKSPLMEELPNDDEDPNTTKPPAKET